MKIVFFDEDRRPYNTLEHVENPIPYGISEVRWKDGGHAYFSGNYVILNDDVDFKTLTEEEFLRQYKEQAKYELAKKLEEKRVFLLVEGTYAEHEQQFEQDKITIDSKTSIEEVILFLNEWKTR